MAKAMDIEALVRDNIRKLVPYASARDEFSGSASVFLDANENPLSPPLNRYPDPGQKALKEKIAVLRRQDPANLFLGNGSDEAIDLLFRVFCEPGRDHVITVDPTYGMYGVCADINAVERKSVLLNPDFSLDPQKVLSEVDEHSKLIFLCSPNNPTSNSLDRDAMLELVEQAPCMVVVDEAYVEFSDGADMLDLVPEKPNLVVLRTFSKAWGLAGIRLGMAFAHPRVISYLSAVKYPYNVNSLTMDKALEVMEGPETTDAFVHTIIRERGRLAEALGHMPFIKEVFPSDANFLLVRCQDPTGLYESLMEQGIIVRDRSRVPLCDACLRITVGSPEENTLLLNGLEVYASETNKR